MKTYLSIAAAFCLAAGVAGCSGDDPAAPPAGPAPTPIPAAVTFDVTDEAGRWFDTGVDIDGNGPSTTRSLAIVKPGDKVAFLQTKSMHGTSGANGPSRVESYHTVTSLIWPAGTTADERIDQKSANKDDHEVILNTPGLHVFVCKVHPYMLAGVIVDDPNTKTATGDAALDISDKLHGDKLHLLGVTHTVGVKQAADDTKAFSSNSNLALRLVRAFFVVTSPSSNWKDYTKASLPSPDNKYKPTYPPVTVRLNPVGLLSLPDGIVPDLNAALQGSFDGEVIDAPVAPTTPGVGEVWVDTQYETSAGKGEAYPSTITVVDAATWKVKRKIALPAQKMNNGHNMWASHDQNQIYQTEWHGKSLYVLNRADGSLKQPELVIGNDPAHVMTRVDTEQVHVGLNGEDAVVELNKLVNGNLEVNPARQGGQGRIPVQLPGQDQAQPHAHWMSFDGQSMVTPNSNSWDSTLFDFTNYSILAKNQTGPLPIAAAMDPLATRYYVSNYLGHSTSVMCGPKGQPLTCGGKQPGEKIVDISLLQNYDLNSGTVGGNGAIGGLPIQTPVSADGKFVVTGNTLTATITIIDTSKIDPADPVASQKALVKSLKCDPGCHGVNFGAKKGGGYYAYVTSKFANRLLVYDIDPDGNGDAADATLVGSVLLANDSAPIDDPGGISGNKGMGGQGVLPVPNVYNGWVQKLPKPFCDQLEPEQRNPVGAPIATCP